MYKAFDSTHLIINCVFVCFKTVLFAFGFIRIPFRNHLSFSQTMISTAWVHSVSWVSEQTGTYTHMHNTAYIHIDPHKYTIAAPSA